MCVWGSLLIISVLKLNQSQQLLRSGNGNPTSLLILWPTMTQLTEWPCAKAQPNSSLVLVTHYDLGHREWPSVIAQPNPSLVLGTHCDLGHWEWPSVIAQPNPSLLLVTDYDLGHCEWPNVIAQPNSSLVLVTHYDLGHCEWPNVIAQPNSSFVLVTQYDLVNRTALCHSTTQLQFGSCDPLWPRSLRMAQCHSTTQLQFCSCDQSHWQWPMMHRASFKENGMLPERWTV